MSKRRKKSASSGKSLDLFREELFSLLSILDLQEYASLDGRSWKLWEDKSIEKSEKIDILVESAKKRPRKRKNPLMVCIEGVEGSKTRSLFEKYFPEENDNDHSLQSIRWFLFDHFLGGTSKIEKMRTEEDNIETFDDNFLESGGVEFVTISGKVIPLDIVKNILEYVERNYKIVVNVGSVCRLFYMIILSTFDVITIRQKIIYDISVFALKNTRKIRLQSSTFKDFKSLFRTIIDPRNRKLEVLEIDNSTQSYVTGIFRSIKSEDMVFQNVKEINSLQGIFPNRWTTEVKKNRYGVWYEHLQQYGKKMKKKFEFDYSYHFPSLVRLRGMLDVFSDSGIRGISNNLVEITFSSNDFFLILDSSSDRLDPDNPYYGKARNRNHGQLNMSKLRNEILKHSPFVFNHEECDFSNVTKVCFNAINKLQHPEEAFTQKSGPLFQYLHPRRKEEIDYKQPLIIDLFPSVRELTVDVYGRDCMCAKNVLMSVERLTSSKNSKLEKFVLRSHHGFRRGGGSRNEVIHFCNDFVLPKELKIRELQIYMDCSNEKALNSSRYDGGYFSMGSRHQHMNIVDFNLHSLLEKGFFTFNSIKIFRGVLPFGLGRLDGYRSFSGFQRQYNVPDEVLDGAEKTVRSLISFMKDEVTKNFEVFDLILHTRDSTLEKETLRIKFDSQFQTTEGTKRKFFFKYKKMNRSEESSVWEGSWRWGNTYGNKKSPKLTTWADMVWKTDHPREIRNLVQSEKRPLKVLSAMFVGKVVPWLMKKNRNVEVDFFQVELGARHDFVWKDFVKKTVVEKVDCCDGSTFEREGLLVVKRD